MDWRYANARKRHAMGVPAMTDAEIVIEQEKEIERYRATIQSLDEKIEKGPEPWGFGDICTVNLNGEIVSFSICSVNREVSKDRFPGIEIKGTVV